MGFLAEKPVTLIWGIGKAFASTLERDGIRTIGQLQRMELADLMRGYGTMGSRLLPSVARHRHAPGGNPTHEAKSISAETTFNSDIADLAELTSILRTLSEKVSRRLKKSGLAGRTVVLKLKDDRFPYQNKEPPAG